jgi:hypothetical protein
MLLFLKFEESLHFCFCGISSFQQSALFTGWHFCTLERCEEQAGHPVFCMGYIVTGAILVQPTSSLQKTQTNAWAALRQWM